MSKTAYIAYTVLGFSIIVCLIILYDPFNIRRENSEMRISQQNIDSVAQKLYETCSNGNTTRADRDNCYQEELQSITKTIGLQTGEAILSSLQDKDPTTLGCHIIAHRMSAAAYAIDPRDFFDLIKTVNVQACGGGFLHGLLGSYEDTHPNLKIDGSFGNTICSSTDTYWKSSCLHFIGHMFMLDNNGNTSIALSLCKNIDARGRFNCYDGVFMEDHQKLMMSEHGLLPLPELTDSYINSLERSCRNYASIIASACWTEMAEMYAHTYGYEPEIIHTHCNKAQIEAFAFDCYMKGVIAMSIYPGFDTTEKLYSLCSFYENETEHYDYCSHTILSSLLYNSPKFINRGITYCSVITKMGTKPCFQDLAEILTKTIKQPASRIPYCEKLPENVRQICSS